MRGRQLPPICWASVEPFDFARFNPVTLGPVGDVVNKPRGGLWCAPLLTAQGRKFSAWSLESQLASGSELSLLTRVVPRKAAKVAVVTSRDDLLAITARWPDTRPDPLAEVNRLLRTPPSRLIDWSLMADEVDAVWLTAAGLNQTSSSARHPNLWGWDVPTVLFLKPAFSLGAEFKFDLLTSCD